MKLKFIQLFSLVVICNISNAQTDLIFKAGFEFISKFNDTGIIWAGELKSNNTECTSTTITTPQDCNTGRDADPLTNSDDNGHAGFSFTKLDASGAPLADQSVGYATTPWACVKDNVTGLIWEVKTTTAGIHNKDNTYQWGGDTAIGKGHPNALGIYYDPSWNELVQGSNTDSFCGVNNWRVPTVDELDDLANNGTFNPAIDVNYFPNTISLGFWSSSPVANFDDYAWIVDFYYGNSSYDGRDIGFRVRLVRSLGQ